MSSLVTTIRQQCSSPCSDILLQSTRLSVSSPNPAVVRRCTHRCRRDLCDARCSSDVSDDTLDAAAANLLASSPLKSCCCSGAVTTRDDSSSSKRMFAKSFAGAGIGRILTRARLWPWNAISQHPETILLLILCREESTLIFYPLSQVADRSARIGGVRWRSRNSECFLFDAETVEHSSKWKSICRWCDTTTWRFVPGWLILHGRSVFWHREKAMRGNANTNLFIQLDIGRTDRTYHLLSLWWV